jgi:ABC-type microcin C transport system permease subunit YejE
MRLLLLLTARELLRPTFWAVVVLVALFGWLSGYNVR